MTDDAPAAVSGDAQMTSVAPEEGAPGTAVRWARAIAVHLFTAAGAGLAWLALVAATETEWPFMFLMLGIALIVDGIDGTLARHCRVAEFAPRWSGDVLDLVVDFTTYVFVPAYAIAASGTMPPAVSLPLCVAIVMASAMYFSDRRMKTADSAFRGFPALWNIVAFYLFVLRPPDWAASAGIVALLLLTFAPVRFIHPMRTRRLRWLNIPLLLVWAALALYTIYQDLDPGQTVAIALVVIGAYFLGSSLWPWRPRETANSTA